MPDNHNEAVRRVLRVVPLITRAVAAEMRPIAHPSHYHLLAMLAHRARPVSELAEHQGVSLPSMSSTLRTLEERGWVRRAAAEHDRRVVLVELDGEGAAALAEMQQRGEARLHAALANLDEAGLAALLAGLDILEAAFAIEPEPECARPLPGLERTNAPHHTA